MSAVAPHPARETAPPSGSATRQIRVALLTNENAPYRVPLYTALGETPGWDFRVFTCIDREHDRQWAVADDLPFQSKKSFSLRYTRRQRVDGPGALATRRQVHLPVGAAADVLRFRPDVVISSEFGARTMLATLTARLTGHRLLVYSESTPHTEANPSTTQSRVRRYLSRRLDGCICNGKQARLFLEDLGVPAESIVEVGQAIDVDSFDHAYSHEEREQARAELGADGVAFLYVGHMVLTKGLGQLLDAWAEFSQSVDGPVSLLLAGNGDDLDELKAKAKGLGLENVRFLGFRPREELSRVYAAADVFVFPTLRDCFSLAFEEAMSAGLPVIGSVYGGESELVEDGVNGWVADPLVADSLTAQLHKAYAAGGSRGEMGRRARAAIEPMAIDRVAERIRGAVEGVLSAPRRSRRGRPR